MGFSRLFVPLLFCHLRQLTRYGWTCVCWDKIVTIYLTENVKSFLIYTLVFNIWVSFPNVRRNALISCYCWLVMINKVTFTAIINIRQRCSKRYGGFKVLMVIVMLWVDLDLWKPVPGWWSSHWVLIFIPYLFPWSFLSFDKPI